MTRKKEIAELEIFKNLQIVDIGVNEPIGKRCKQWIIDFASLALDKKNKIKELFLLIPKKNSKSTYAAAITLTASILNDKHYQEFLIVAATKEIALNSFTPVCGMIENDNYLLNRYTIHKSTKEIYDNFTNSTIKIISCDTQTLSGKKAGFVLFDEFWLFGKMANAESIVAEATGGFLIHNNPKAIFLSTQSDEPPCGIFKRYLKKLELPKIEQKKIGFYGLKFAIDEKKDLKSLTIKDFEKVNPNSGVSLNLDMLFNNYKDILKSEDEKAFQVFCAKHLNSEIKIQAKQHQQLPFLDLDIFADLDYDSSVERGDVITVGIDGGGLKDWFGFAVCCRIKGEWHYFTKSLIMRKAFENNKENQAIMQDFIKQSDLLMFDDMNDLYQKIADFIKPLKNKIHAIGFDPSGSGILSDFLKEQGVVYDDQVVGIYQGARLAGTIKTIEQKAALGQLKINNTPMIKWQLANACYNNKGYIEKPSDHLKIDSVIAIINASTIMAVNPEPLIGGITGFSI